MKLITIAEAKKSGIFRIGDLVDLTEIIHPEDERKITLLREATGVEEIQLLKSQNLTWFYAWNSREEVPTIVGLPTKENVVMLKGKIGFINGITSLDEAVDRLYGNINENICGRHISEEDINGISKYEVVGRIPFEEMLKEIDSLKNLCTGTPCVESFIGERCLHKIINCGIKKVRDISTKQAQYQRLYTVCNDELTEFTITTQLFPVLYGKIDKLLVDVSNPSEQHKAWKLYPSNFDRKFKNVISD